MKKLPILFSIILLSLSLFSTPSIDEIGDNGTVIIQINELTAMQNIDVIALFKNDPKLTVINTCQLLGIIVLDNKGKSDLSSREAAAYVSLKLKSIFETTRFSVLDTWSKDQVNEQCRVAVSKLQDN